MDLPIDTNILKKSLAGKIVNRLQYFLKPAIAQTALNPFAALGTIAEVKRAILIFDVADIERRCTLAGQ